MQPFGTTCSNLWWKLLLTPSKLLPYANGVESSAFSPNHRFPLYLLYMVPWSFSVLDIWLLCPVIRLLPVAPWLRVTLCEISISAARASVCLPHYSWTPSSLWPQMLHPTLAHLPKDEVPVTSTGQIGARLDSHITIQSYIIWNISYWNIPHSQSVSYSDLVSTIYQKFYQEQELKKLIRGGVRLRHM